MWKDCAGETHSQELDDSFDPSGEDHTPVFSVAGIVASDVIVRWAASVSAESDVLFQALAVIKKSGMGYQLTNKKRIRAFTRSSRYWILSNGFLFIFTCCATRCWSSFEPL